MNNQQRAEWRAVATLLEQWPKRDATAIGSSGPVVSVADAIVKDYCVHVSTVTL